MSDSSSDEEISEELLASVDKNLMNNSLFSENKVNEKDSKPNQIEKLPSLRSIYKDEQFTSTGLSKEKKKFIAKKLEKVLDDRLKETSLEKSNKSRVDKNENDCTGGVLLFSSSNDYLNPVEEDYVRVTKKRKIKDSNKMTDSELATRCKEVAVSSDWILSGNAIKGWTKKCKGEVIRVKKIKKTDDSNILNCKIIK